MSRFLWLGSLSIIALGMGVSPVAWAGQATAAPTRPVYSKSLAAPEIPSDTRKLEAIVDNDNAAASAAAQAAAPAPAPAPTPAPQTILVMPSAAAAPTPEPAPAPALSPSAAALPLVPETPRAQRHEPDQDTPPPVDNNARETSNENSVWHQWFRDPTSVFTAFIALFTCLLAIAGGYYVYASGATSRRQLRSYVFITNTEISGVAPLTQPVAQLVIRNTGQTPAHDVIVYGNMVFDEFPLQKDLPVLVFPDPQLTKENLGPGSERYKWEYALVPLTDDQINKMNAGTHALYVYGEIRYHDVFGRKRFTKYLYYTGGTMGIRGNILGGYPEGNEAI